MMIAIVVLLSVSTLFLLVIASEITELKKAVIAGALRGPQGAPGPQGSSSRFREDLN